jgi:hypothetical protein
VSDGGSSEPVSVLVSGQSMGRQWATMRSLGRPFETEGEGQVFDSRVGCADEKLAYAERHALDILEFGFRHGGGVVQRHSSG